MHKNWERTQPSSNREERNKDKHQEWWLSKKLTWEENLRNLLILGCTGIQTPILIRIPAWSSWCSIIITGFWRCKLTFIPLHPAKRQNQLSQTFKNFIYQNRTSKTKHLWSTQGTGKFTETCNLKNQLNHANPIIQLGTIQ